MRVPLIAGNWKMNTTVGEAIALVREMHPGIDKIENVEKVLCPPFISLAAVYGLVKGSSIKLGAQNMYFKDKGAYTGEISSIMLTDLCEFVIIGHSERRQYFSESGETINQKVKAALKVGLKPILCVGEKLEDNEAGRAEKVVTGQLESALAGVGDLDGLVIAYEPVWAIGTGRAATGEQANEIIGFIRHNVAKLHSKGPAQNLRILYGGSVTAVNSTEFLKQLEIDGALVGGASLDAGQFLSIVRQTAEIKA